MEPVSGVFVLRFTEPDLPRPFRVPAYPLVPAAFVLVNALILVFVLQSRPLAAGAGLLTILAGVVLALLQKHWR